MLDVYYCYTAETPATNFPTGIIKVSFNPLCLSAPSHSFCLHYTSSLLHLILFHLHPSLTTPHSLASSVIPSDSERCLSTTLLIKKDIHPHTDTVSPTHTVTWPQALSGIQLSLSHIHACKHIHSHTYKTLAYTHMRICTQCVGKLG